MARKTPKATRRTAAKTPRKQPESLRLVSIIPSLTVRDLVRSLAWYEGVLGFHVAERWDEGDQLVSAEVRAGTVAIILNQDDFAKGRDRKFGEGFRIYGNTRQDVDRLAAAIKARGGALAQEPHDRPWGTRDFSLVDPDGYRIAIQSMI